MGETLILAYVPVCVGFKFRVGSDFVLFLTDNKCYFIQEDSAVFTAHGIIKDSDDLCLCAIYLICAMLYFSG